MVFDLVEDFSISSKFIYLFFYKQREIIFPLKYKVITIYYFWNQILLTKHT